MKSWRDEPDYIRAEAKWRETHDIMYAVLAIGYWRGRPNFPALPPEWALDACLALHDKATARLEPVVKKTQGKRPDPKDYDRIMRVAEARNHGSKKSSRQLFIDILEAEQGFRSDALESDLRRLMNYYGKEYILEDNSVANYHISRAARLAARSRGFGKTFGDFEPKE